MENFKGIGGTSFERWYTIINDKGTLGPSYNFREELWYVDTRCVSELGGSIAYSRSPISRDNWLRMPIPREIAELYQLATPLDGLYFKR